MSEHRSPDMEVVIGSKRRATSRRKAKTNGHAASEPPPPEPGDPGRESDHGGETNGSAKHDLYALEPFAELETWKPDEERDLIVGILPANGLAFLYGAPKSKKSFIALDMGMAVARATITPDITWGRRIVQPGIVVAIIGEGAHGSRKRRAAYLKHCDVSPDTPFYVIAARPNLGAEISDRAKLIKSIETVLGERRPALIIIDTLSRMLHGQSENAEGMDRFIENAEALSERFDCLALAVHHQPWDAKRMRGHSSSAGASVATMRAEKAGKLETKLFVEEAKDDEDELAFAVRFRCVDMGYSETHKRQTTTLLVEAVAPDAVADRPETKEKWQQAYDILLACLNDHPQERPRHMASKYPNQNLTHVTHFRDELVTWGVTGDKGTSTERTAWMRITETLKKKGFFREYKGLCWCPVTRKKSM